jgi:hypothetical protein
MPLPSELPDHLLVENFFQQREMRLLLDKKAIEAKALEEDLSLELQRRMIAGNASALASEKHLVRLHKKEVPQAEDWARVTAYIVENDAFDLLQRRLSSAACAARWADGVQIPGVGKFVKYSVTVGKM